MKNLIKTIGNRKKVALALAVMVTVGALFATAGAFASVNSNEIASSEDVKEETQSSGEDSTVALDDVSGLISAEKETASAENEETAEKGKEEKNAATAKSKSTTSKGSTSNSGSVGADSLESAARAAFNLINNYRVSQGVPALTWSSSDAKIATVRAKELATDFSHASASGVSKRTAENISKSGALDPAAVVNGWINSSSHRSNILDRFNATAGLAVYECDGWYYWSNNFSAAPYNPNSPEEMRGNSTRPTRSSVELDSDGWSKETPAIKVEVIEKKNAQQELTGYTMSVSFKIGTQTHNAKISNISLTPTPVFKMTMHGLVITNQDNGRLIRAHYTNGKMDAIKWA